MENKKNTILLTVIAVATLLVAVVGATFAYFTASGAQGTTGNVTVSTGTAARSEFGTMNAINLYADASTFAEGGKDVTGSSTGTVIWIAPGATSTTTPSEADRTFCYTAALEITANTFVKSAANTSNVNELEFTAVKGTTTIIDKQSLVNLTTGKAVTGTINIPTIKGGTDMKHTLVADAGASNSDSWTITVTLKNQAFNQNDNAGKQFTGVIRFNKTTC